MLTLIFDGRCRICTWAVRWLQAHDRAGRILAVPNQAPGVPAAFGLTAAEADRAVWVFDEGGRGWAGAAAVNRLLAALGGPWAVLARLYRLPGLRWLEDRLYRVVSVSRHALDRWGVGVTPACDRPGAACRR